MNFEDILDKAVRKAVEDYRLMQQNQKERSGSNASSKKFPYGREETFVAMLYHNLRVKDVGVDNLRLEYQWKDLDKKGNPEKGAKMASIRDQPFCISSDKNSFQCYQGQATTYSRTFF